jgi:hypothetical protein
MDTFAGGKMNWKPGDIAIIEAERGLDPCGVNGEICTLVEYMGDGWYENINHRVWNAWAVQVFRGQACVAQEALRRLPPPEKGTWEDCIWQPRVLERVDVIKAE